MISRLTFKKIQRHHIAVLIAAGLICLIAVLKFHNAPQLQFLILFTLILIYLIWGFIYHYFDRTLKLEIILEYILTALLAMTVLYGVLL